MSQPRTVWVAALYIGASALMGCRAPAPLTGDIPGLATGNYAAPSDAEASAAFIGTFVARYDRPHLDYPPEIKARIRAARRQQLRRDVQLMQKRQESMAQLAYLLAGSDDPRDKSILENIGKRADELDNLERLDEDSLDRLFALFAQAETKGEHRAEPSITKRETTYKNAMRRYKTAFQSISVSNCKWIDTHAVLYTGTHDLARVHGARPRQAWRCEGVLRLKPRDRDVQAIRLHDIWAKGPDGAWDYYGSFPGVAFAPRKLSLDPELLADPEAAILSRRAWELGL